MEGVPPSCNEDDVNLTSNQFDIQSPEDSFNISEFLLYVILKHILSEDDYLQFSYSTVYPIYYSMEAGRQTTKAPYHAMIKMDRTWWWITMWSTIVLNKQLCFHLHFLKPWWVLMPTPLCYNVHWISKCLYHPLDQKVLCFRVSTYLEHLQNVYC